MQEVEPVTCAYKDQPFHRRFRAIVSAIPARSRVFDIACGSGRLMIELERKGCHCVGVDAYPDFVARARAKGLAVTQGDANGFDTDPKVRDLILQEYDAVIFSKCLMYIARKNELLRALRTTNVFINQYNPDLWKHKLKQWLGLKPESFEQFPYRTADGAEIEINSRAALRRWGESYGYSSRVLMGSAFRSHDTVVHLWRK